jgi:serine/threonine-protein kinase
MERILIGADFEGRYHIEAELGSGGVGTVYRARDAKLGRPVAIKVLQEKYGASRELRHRFEREAHALAALSHPHVVTVTDFGVSHGMPYLVMELLEGTTLSDRLESGPLGGEEAIDVTRQVLRALTFVHDQGFVHRDMKPGNIFLQSVPGSNAHVKILDFGLAKVLERDQTTTVLTRAGQVFGTPSYMAPEQVGAESTDARTDLYAVGIILFEMLAGRPPFRGDVTEVMRQQLVEPLPGIG